jgi:DNA-binding beta-propeller fold protein YncE
VFVSNDGNNSIVEYNTSGGSSVATLAGQGLVLGLALGGNDLYVANDGSGGSVGFYNLATGQGDAYTALVTTGLSSPFGLALTGDGNDLLVANQGNSSVAGSGSIGYINLATKAYTTLISGLTVPDSLAVVGNNLYVTQAGLDNGEFSGTGSITEYGLGGTDAALTHTAATTLVSGINVPQGLVVVPEPSNWALMAGGAATLFVLLRRKRLS